MFREHQVQEKLLPNLLGMIHFTEKKCMFLHTLDTKCQGLSSSSYDELVIGNFESVRFMRQATLANRLTVHLIRKKKINSSVALTSKWYVIAVPYQYHLNEFR